MTAARRLRNDWKDDFRELLAGARTRIVISSPFVTMRGAEFVLGNVCDALRPQLSLHLLTDLSALNVAQASTDPRAVAALTREMPHATVVHLPRLHAKVYVADSATAIVTSGNLTAGGLELNYEYGLRVLDADTARSIEEDVVDYAALGARVPPEALHTYCERSAELQRFYADHSRATAASARRLRAAVQRAEDELIHLRLAGGAMHTVFASTIAYLLARHGPMSTVELHPRIQGLHPDLCDDSVDRVIAGKRFGKKWKHAVRTAQQQLKKLGRIVLVDGKWTLR